MSDELLLAIDDGIAWITLNRPEVGNAITPAMARSLLDAAIRCDGDPAVRCVVISGAGKLFCAGGDVALFGNAGADLPALLTDMASYLHAAVVRFARMRKPLVTLVNGSAAGAGFSLAILGDIVLSARSASYTAAYGAVGLTSDGGLSWLLPRLVGLRKAQEIILTNRRIDSREAAEIGLVTRTAEDGDLVDEGRTLARRLAETSGAAYGATRTLLLDSFETGLELQLDRELRSMVDAGAGDAQRRIADFMASRKARSAAR